MASGKRSPPPLPPPGSSAVAAPPACQVQCAGCRCVLNVPPGVIEFRCPKCKLAQMLPPQLHPQVMLPPPPPPPPLPLPSLAHLPPLPKPPAPGDPSKIQLPCANCRAVLSVPSDLTRFVCPQCHVELAVDPAKLAGYMNSLAQLSYLNAGNKDVDDPLLWNTSLDDINEVALEVEKEEDENGTIGDTFTEYKPSKLSIGPPHPDPIVETSSLSSIQPPEPTYSLKIAKELEDAGALSCLQLETLVYACQRHLQHLADGTRAGFFIGDGAGVGKGRTVAGLIWENWQHGRHKALWISVGSDLKFDARRDLDDIGAACIEVHALNKLPYGKLDAKAIGVKEGVVFLTYSSLIASSEKGRSRLQQLIQWCGPDFDGVIIFDECHKAKNLIPDSGTHATRTGEAVVEMQKRLPEARIVYCSATGASEPRNLGYMGRLGLWGKGTDFPHFHAFLAALEKRGMGALELVAMDMKARGMYVCRTLSFKGAEFEVVEVPLEPAMKDMYAKATRIWGDLRVEFMQASELLQDKKPLSQLWRVFWANHQRFFSHMCMSAKVPAAVRLAKQALAEDKCVVIGLQSTGEARTEEAINKYGAELEDFVSGPKELLLKLVEDYYPLPQQCKDDEVSEDNIMGKKKKVKDALSGDELEEDVKSEWETDSSGSEEEDKVCRVCGVENRTLKLLVCSLCGMAAHYQCLPPAIAETSDRKWLCPPCAEELREIRRARKHYFSELRRRYADVKSRKLAALEVIRSLEFSNNPLDDIIDQLGGPDCVAEMTGRRGMLVRASNGKGVVYQPRNTKDVPIEMINMHEKQQFMEGKKHVAVISEAASAGISLQADRRAINQRRRVHITLELPWSADRAIQQFGRTHRSNQASAPQYRLLFTNLGGERRFASIVAKRLETLGALTQGDRRAGPSLSAFNYDSAYGKKALSMMYKSVMEQVDLPVLPTGCSSGSREVVKNSLMEARAVLLAVGIIRDAFPMDPEDRRPSGRIAEGDMHDVARFLNRILGVPPDVQNWLFEYFVTIFDELIHDARNEGQFDSGIVDIKASLVELQGLPKTVHVDRLSGAPTTHTVLSIDRGLTFEAACLELERMSSDKAKFPDNGFYRSKREWLGRTHFLLAIERMGLLPRVFRIIRPATGEALREMVSTELFAKYEKVNLNDQVKEGWIHDYALSAQQCTHGPNCKLGLSCTVGRRVQEVHILGGLILPVWGSVENSLAKQGRAAHRRLRVVRIETTTPDKTRVVGLHIPTIAIGDVLEGLGWLQKQG